MARKRISSIPDVPNDVPASLRRWLLTTKEAVEVRLGRRGDPSEAAVTFNDLIDMGVMTGAGKINPLTGLPILTPVFPELPDGNELPDFGTPPQPTNVVALGVFGGIHVLWDRPAERPDITFTEVYRSQDADFENADVIGGTGGASYFDIITQTDEVTYWYWVRHVSITGDVGPLSEVVTATKPATTEYILDRLAQQLSTNEFVQDLNERIDLIDGSSAVPGSVNARIQDEAITRQDEDQALAQQITTVQANLGDDIASVQQSFDAYVIQNDDQVLQLGAQFTLKLDVDGYVSGYTTYNDGTTSAIVYRVDTFAIGSPGDPDYFPFVLDDGVVYIDTAVIKEGSIESGKIGSITFGQVTDGSGNPVTTVGGLLRVDYIDVNNITVTNAMIEDATITNTKIANAAITTAKIVDGSINSAKIVNGAITTAKIGDAAVDTLKLAGQAVTIPSGAYTAGSTSSSSTSFRTIQSITYTSSGAPVIVTFHARIVGPTSGVYQFRVLRGGSTIWGPTGFNDNDGRFYAGCAYDTLSTSGPRTYYIQVRRSAGSGTWSATYRTLTTLEAKR